MGVAINSEQWLCVELCVADSDSLELEVTMIVWVEQ